MEAGICELDMIAEGRSLTAEELLKREEYSRNLEWDLYLEEVSWRQQYEVLPSFSKLKHEEQFN
jgi:hypothetical protein